MTLLQYHLTSASREWTFASFLPALIDEEPRERLAVVRCLCSSM